MFQFCSSWFFKYNYTYTSFYFCRLRIQYENLQKEESEQNEFIDQFILQK